MSRIKAARSKVALAAGAAVLAGLGVGATAAPAQAAWSDCSSGALCAYLSTNGGGDPGEVFGNNNDLRQYNKFNNARSVYNNGNQCDVRIYTLLNRQGSSVVLHRGNAIYDTHTWNGGMFRYGVASNVWVNC
ncbi:peptidase inhibitor family I36 protein [Streptomyces sp. DH37]|uniref:peptidase inhibitor family I36 protein n=1 Tax=Streptomyces sp. DH37 TaxID=3040122 RepID=UPI002441AF2C|nr:peptidase inhibitor family I36 protein [Streptomyces sp. DH37]MDG9703100.1 peptidase inhibitor family I36 protein [Streptomyces sp. DH37]